MENLEKILKYRGIKLSWLAGRLDVSSALISMWIKGKRTPNELHKKEVSWILQIPEEML